jgi:hypothetical protein
MMGRGRQARRSPFNERTPLRSRSPCTEHGQWRPALRQTFPDRPSRRSRAFSADFVKPCLADAVRRRRGRQSFRVPGKTGLSKTRPCCARSFGFLPIAFRLTPPYRRHASNEDRPPRGWGVGRILVPKLPGRSKSGASPDTVVASPSGAPAVDLQQNRRVASQ